MVDDRICINWQMNGLWDLERETIQFLTQWVCVIAWWQREYESTPNKTGIYHSYSNLIPIKKIKLPCKATHYSRPSDPCSISKIQSKPSIQEIRGLIMVFYCHFNLGGTLVCPINYMFITLFFFVASVGVGDPP